MINGMLAGATKPENTRVSAVFKKLTQASQPHPSENRQKQHKEAVSLWLKQKPYYRKLIMMKKHKVMSQRDKIKPQKKN